MYSVGILYTGPVWCVYSVGTLYTGPVWCVYDVGTLSLHKWRWPVRVGALVPAVAGNLENGGVDAAGGVGAGNEGDVVQEDVLHDLVVAAGDALSVRVPRVCRRHRSPLGPARTRPAARHRDRLHADQAAAESTR